MDGLGFTYDQESVQMERAVADILLTQADLLPWRHMCRQAEVCRGLYSKAIAAKLREKEV